MTNNNNQIVSCSKAEEEFRSLVTTFGRNAFALIYDDAKVNKEEALEKVCDVMFVLGMAVEKKRSGAPVYPVIEDQLNLFSTTVKVNNKKVNVDTEVLLHDIYDLAKDWTDVTDKSVAKSWHYLYEELERSGLIKAGGRKQYRAFVNTVVKYCVRITDEETKKLCDLLQHPRKCNALRNTLTRVDKLIEKHLPGYNAD